VPANLGKFSPVSVLPSSKSVKLSLPAPTSFRKDFLDELVKLQDQLPPFDNDIAFALIETEFGMFVEKAYREISPTPGGLWPV
jgi:hypothetical protein